MDNLSKEQRRRNMQAVRSSHTLAENALAKALWSRGYRYRRNDRNIIGKPDLSFRRYFLAIFVDGEFWHGRNWVRNKFRIKSKRKYWWGKIEHNMERDSLVNKTLRRSGWKVLRFWDADIKKKLDVCLRRIESQINSGSK